MSNKILVPTLGESVTEATVSKWLKTQGDSVTADEPVVELETDKVNVEVPAPSNGVLDNISVKEGETVNVGSVLGIINGNTKQNVESIKEVKPYSPPKINNNILPEPKKEVPLIFNEEPKTIETEKEEPLILDNVHKEEITKVSRETNMSPSARKIAIESNIDINKITRLMN